MRKKITLGREDPLFCKYYCKLLIFFSFPVEGAIGQKQTGVKTRTTHTKGQQTTTP